MTNYWLRPTWLEALLLPNFRSFEIGKFPKYLDTRLRIYPVILPFLHAIDAACIRATPRHNRDGSTVTYYALAKAVWNPIAKRREARLIHSFGRADQIDHAALQRLAARSTHHNRHLALNGKPFRPICIDARGGASASHEGALRRPLGLDPCIIRHFQTSSCGEIDPSRMSQLTVPHPTGSSHTPKSQVAREPESKPTDPPPSFTTP
jgi:hypothetical protein